MKVYNSPYNKIIKYNDKYLIFAGNTGNIKLISIKDIIKLKLKLLNSPEKQEYLKYGFILPENYKKFLLKIQGKAVKDIVKSDLSLVIIPTMLCNLKCSYCFVQKQVKNVCMSKETIDKIIHLIGANNGKYSVEWFGGEPTLSVDLMNYFYSEANKKNYINKFSLLISNGTFENNLCWDIIENYITSIQITIDGPLEIHNKRRIYKNGKGSFEKVIKNLDILYSKIKKWHSLSSSWKTEHK